MLVPKRTLRGVLFVGFAIPCAMAMLVAARSSGKPQTATRAKPVESAQQGTGADGCPVFERMSAIGRIGHRQLVEASGLVVSDQNPGVLWLNNDSGGRPELFALALSGQPLAEFTLLGADANDWEDLAIGPGPDPRKRYLYVGDIGNNDRKRESIVVYRVEEPPLAPPLRRESQPRRLAGVSRFELRYDHGAAHDAEALIVDPKNADLYVITKSLLHTPRVYQAKAPHSQTAVGRLIDVGSLDFVRQYSVFPPLVTAADISRDRKWIVVRTYVHAFLYQCQPSQGIPDCIRTTPCVVPLRFEPQGEAIAWMPDGSGYLTTSEGQSAAIHHFRRQR